MNDNNLDVSLREAYSVQPLSEDRLADIGRRVRLGAVRKSLRRKIFAAAGAVALLAAAGFTYPVAAANLYGMNLLRKMSAQGPYKVRVFFNMTGGPINGARKDPLEMLVDGLDEYLPARPGTTVFTHIDSHHSIRELHPASNVAVVWPPDPGADTMLRLPLALAEKLGKFDSDKQFVQRGTKTIGGRRVDEVSLKISGEEVFVMDLDPDSGLLVSMTIPSIRMTADDASIPDWNLGLHFDYAYDVPNAQRTIDDLKRQEGQMRELRLERDCTLIQREVFTKPLCQVQTGRDILKVYQVQQNAAGNVLVLFTARSNRPNDIHNHPLIQLQDEAGEPWLSALLDLSQSKLAPKGEDLHAQVFFHRKSPRILRQANLSIQLAEGDYVYPGLRIPGSKRTVDLGSFVPTKVGTVPLWYFYAIGTEDESWLTNMAKELRFQAALNDNDFVGAILIGREFYAAFPEFSGSLSYTRADVAYGLAKAYRGIGDVAAAHHFEMLSKGAEIEPERESREKP